ncbi:hypothetical protein [Enterobacter hormaechei]|uniref:hypothetical protein n=1 Tax=Enterobacter hormaechei TaxID=158836 RepID=UPI0026E179FA|nr:hypothetical protein [Enterobacter hormaechei]MDO6168691.1 hypothetical protein [Enterobacter hormaechei]MDO6172970.1 hypothetical protein [Enterobacter hormaechei]
MILIYTCNQMVANAIKSLPGERDGYFFNNKYSFLLCASIFENAVKLIDVIDRNSYKDAGWLTEALDERKIKNVCFLINKKYYYPWVPRKNLIYDISGLELLWKKKLTINEIPTLTDTIKGKLTAKCYEFLLMEAFSPEDALKYKQSKGIKNYCNLKYKIQKQLNLKNKIEYNLFLILFRKRRYGQINTFKFKHPT